MLESSTTRTFWGALLASSFAALAACGESAPASEADDDTASGAAGASSGRTSSGGTSSGGTSSGGGGRAGSGPSAGQGGSAGNGASGAGNGGGTSGDGGSAGSASAGTTSSIGRIQVYRTLAWSNTSRVTATFDLVEQAAWDALGDELGAGEPSTCVTVEYGNCSLTTCTEPTDPDPGTPPDDLPSLDRLDAGTITVSADSADFTASGEPSGTNHGYEFTVEGTVSGQQLMTVSATGGPISAFEASVFVPLAPLLTSHPASAEANTVVEIPAPREVDLTIEWDARGTGQEIQLVVTHPTASPLFNCHFDAASGTGTITSEALLKLPVGTELHFFSTEYATASTAEGDIDLLGIIEMFSADKTGLPVFVLE